MSREIFSNELGSMGYRDIGKIFKQLDVTQFNADIFSKDPNRKVGCCIVDENKQHVHFSYNGFPAGLEETEEKWKRPTKYNYVVHAEANAVVLCPFNKKGSTVYVTCRPCQNCLKLIVASRVSTLIFVEQSIPLIDNSFDAQSYADLLLHITNVHIVGEKESVTRFIFDDLKGFFPCFR